MLLGSRFGRQTLSGILTSSFSVDLGKGAAFSTSISREMAINLSFDAKSAAKIVKFTLKASV